MMHDFLLKFGLADIQSVDEPYSYQSSDYAKDQTPAPENIQLHRDFLKSLNEEESKRLDLLEAKTSQMISQTSIVFSLLSLFVPLLIEKVENLSFGLCICFFLLLCLSFGFYILTIRNSLKNFDIKKHVYSKPSPVNVLKYQERTKEDFLVIETRDLLYSINQNTKTNNIKATNLIHSYNSFKAGNLLTAALVLLFCVYFLLIDGKKVKEKDIVNVRIQGLDTSIQNMYIKLMKKQENDSTTKRTPASLDVIRAISDSSLQRGTSSMRTKRKQ